MPLYERGVDRAFSHFLLLGVQVTGSLAVRVALRVICRLRASLGNERLPQVLLLVQEAGPDA